MANDSLVPYGKICRTTGNARRDPLESIFRLGTGGRGLGSARISGRIGTARLFRFIISVAFPNRPFRTTAEKQSFWSELFNGTLPDNSAALTVTETSRFRLSISYCRVVRATVLPILHGRIYRTAGWLLPKIETVESRLRKISC